MSKIKSETDKYKDLEPKNLQEQALKTVGETIYNKLIKGYTEKQWGRKCIDLPASIIKRIPLRFTYDNNYFNDKFQGIPKNGYTEIFENLLKNIEVRLETNFIKGNIQTKKTIYTGMIDQYFEFKLGHLEYRSLDFVTKTFNFKNYQGNAVFNYPDLKDKHTRTIEHKHFNKTLKTEKTIVSWEYSKEFNLKNKDTPYYPIGNDKNQLLFDNYLELTKSENNVFFCGRLGQYKYFDMDDTIEEVLNFLKTL
jgi:UDP-galactopyranose mutase